MTDGVAELIQSIKARGGLNYQDTLIYARDFDNVAKDPTCEHWSFWQTAIDKVAAGDDGTWSDPGRETARRLTLLGLRALQAGRLEALRRFASELIQDDPATENVVRPFLAFGDALHHLNWFHGIEASAAQVLAETALPLLSEREYGSTERMLDALGFHLRSSFVWNDAVFTSLLAPLHAAWRERGKFSSALMLEERVYLDFVRQREDQEHLDRVMAEISIPMADLAAASSLPARAIPRKPEEAPLKIGFILQYGVMAAHTQLLANILRDADLTGLDITLYVRTPTEEFLRTFTPLGVRMVALAGFRQDDPYPFIDCANLVAADHIDLVVFLSLPLWVPYLAGLAMAPRQSFIAMKRHPRGLQRIDLRLAGGPVTGAPVTMGGEIWTGVIPAYDNLPSMRGPRQSRSGTQIVLGTVAREEKIAQTEFLEAIGDVLEKCPSAVFRFTGREYSPVIRRYFDNRGLQERVQFCGWVDMSEFISELDLFLSTFPQGGGVSEVHAMSLGVPVVGWVGDNAVIDKIIAPAATGAGDTAFEIAARAAFVNEDGRFCLPRATSRKEFVDLCMSLIDSETCRNRLGRAEADFAATQLSDTARFGNDIIRHLADCARLGRQGV